MSNISHFAISRRLFSDEGGYASVDSMSVQSSPIRKGHLCLPAPLSPSLPLSVPISLPLSARLPFWLREALLGFALASLLSGVMVCSLVLVAESLAYAGFNSRPANSQCFVGDGQRTANIVPSKWTSSESVARCQYWLHYNVNSTEHRPDASQL